MFSLAKKVHVASTAIGGCCEPAKAPLSIARSLAPAAAAAPSRRQRGSGRGARRGAAAAAAPPSRHRGRGRGARGACLEDAV